MPAALQEPLLPRAAASRAAAPAPQQHDTFWRCTFNLAKAITGAGMMAIPRAYLLIGWLPGTLMLVGVACLTFFTLAVLVRGAAVTRAATYSQLAALTCGRGVMLLLQASVLFFCFGFSVVYNVVIRDILLGTPPDCNGLLCEAFGPAALIDARLLIIGVAVCVCAPLLLLRSMDRLACLNLLGVAATLLLAAAAAGLAAVAAAQGAASPIPMLPQWHLLGPTRGMQLEALAGVLPVILACYVAHQSLFPLMPLLQPYSEARMLKVIACALALACGAFLLLAVGAAAAFGPATSVNVLDNFSVQGLEPLLGWRAAAGLSWALRGGYLVCILGTLLLYMFPLRSCLAEMLWPDAPCVHADALAAAAAASAGGEGGGGSHSAQEEQAPLVAAAGPAEFGATGAAAADAAGQEGSADVGAARDREQERLWQRQALEQQQQLQLQLQQQGKASPPPPVPPAARRAVWQQLEQSNYYALTYGLLAAMVLAAVLVTNIYEAVSAVGDLASTLQAFVVPGVIAIALLRAQHRSTAQAAATAVCGASLVDAEGAAEGQAVAAMPVCRRHRLARLAGALCAALAVLVVLLGLALFGNGVYERLAELVV